MASLKVTDLGEYLREQRQGAKLTLRQLAEAAGVSNPYLSQIERGVRRPSAEVLQQIAKGLRISAEALYVRAGMLDERIDQVEVRAAILSDSGLTERQKQTLIDIYESFRAETARPVTVSEPSDSRGSATKKAAKKAPTKRVAARTTKKAARTTKRTTTRPDPQQGSGRPPHTPTSTAEV